MNRHFADWCRIAGLEVNNSTILLHWNAVETLVANHLVDPHAILDFARIYLGRTSPRFDQAVDCVKLHDPSFPVTKNEVAVRVIVGGALIHLLEKGSKLADAAATAIISNRFGERGEELIPDLGAGALAYVTRRSLEVRAALRDTPKSISTPQVEKYEVEVDVAADPNELRKRYLKLAPIVNSLSGHLVAIRDSLFKLQKSYRASVEALESHGRIAALEEEVNVLWWVFGERSRDLDQRISVLDVNLVPFLLGKELADLVLIIPGPRSAQGLLDRMLGLSQSDKEVEVATAIMASRSWAMDYFASAPPAPDFVPLSTALHLATYHDDPGLLNGALLKASGVQLPLACSPLELASQMYLEGQLLKLLRKS